MIANPAGSRPNLSRYRSSDAPACIAFDKTNIIKRNDRRSSPTSWNTRSEPDAASTLTSGTPSRLSAYPARFAISAGQGNKELGHGCQSQSQSRCGVTLMVSVEWGDYE